MTRSRLGSIFKSLIIISLMSCAATAYAEYYVVGDGSSCAFGCNEMIATPRYHHGCGYHHKRYRSSDTSSDYEQAVDYEWIDDPPVQIK